MNTVKSPTANRIADGVKSRAQWLKQIQASMYGTTRRHSIHTFNNSSGQLVPFLRQGSDQSRCTVIESVELSNDATTDDYMRIRNAHVNFWSTLFSSDENGTETSLSAQHIDRIIHHIRTKVPTRDIDTLDQPISPK